MKKLYFLCVLVIFSLVCMAQSEAKAVKKVAILETVDKERKLDYPTKLMIRSNLVKAISNMNDYEAFDRVDISAIMDEHKFQRTGMVSDNQIKKLGQMTGAQYILIAEGSITKDNKLFIMAKILDVETAKTLITDNVICDLKSDKCKRGCNRLVTNLFGVSATSSAAVDAFFDKFKIKK